MDHKAAAVRRFLHKNELFLLLAVLLIAAALILVLPRRPSGDAFAQVTYDKAVVAKIELTKDGVYHIEGRLPVTLEVKDGKIRFIGSLCPDHVCEGYGWIGTPPESAVCMPALVSVQIADGKG